MQTLAPKQHQASEKYNPALKNNTGTFQQVQNKLQGNIHTAADFTQPGPSHHFGQMQVDTPVTNQPGGCRAGDLPNESAGIALGGEAGVTGAGPQQQVMGGDATTITTGTLSPHEWGNNGFFKWWVKWITNGTSGWIVQKIENTYSGTLSDGSAVTDASVGVTPSYYEAWEVAAGGGITGSLGATGNRDRWERPGLGSLGSETSFSMTGTVYWTSKDPAASGFTSGGVDNAGTLLSSVSAPAGISAPLLTRSAHGRWAPDGNPMLPACFTS